MLAMPVQWCNRDVQCLTFVCHRYNRLTSWSVPVNSSPVRVDNDRSGLSPLFIVPHHAVDV